MAGSVDWSIVYLLSGVATGVISIMLWLWDRFARLEGKISEKLDAMGSALREDFKENTDRLRTEFRREVEITAQNDAAQRDDFNELRAFMQRDSSEWRERVVKLETAWRNGTGKGKH